MVDLGSRPFHSCKDRLELAGLGWSRPIFRSIVAHDVHGSVSHGNWDSDEKSFEIGSWTQGQNNRGRVTMMKWQGLKSKENMSSHSGKANFKSYNKAIWTERCIRKVTSLYVKQSLVDGNKYLQMYLLARYVCRSDQP